MASKLLSQGLLRTSRSLRTLARPSEILAGVSLHSGAMVRVRLLPAAAQSGIQFERIDSQPPVVINARIASVESTVLSTSIGDGSGVAVGTIEHLMAALVGMGVGACRVQVDGPELPVLDGSAAPWVVAIQQAGVTATSQLLDSGDPYKATLKAATLHSPVWVEEGGSWAVAVPAPAPRLTVGIDFPSHKAIGRQWASWSPIADAEHAGVEPSSGTSFVSQVAPARTFALAEQLAELRERGLIQGGSLDNALVCDADRWLNEPPEGAGSPLRFPNEPARHKLLDLIGDLSLLGGGLPRAHVVAFRAGHRLHVELARAIEEQQPE